MKKRILQVVGQLSIGGQEAMVMNFYQYIDKSKYEFDFLVYGETIGYYEEKVKTMGGHVFHIQPFKFSNIIQFQKSLRKIICRNGPYYGVHCHTSLNSAFIIHAAKKLKIPIRITHSHTTKSGKKETWIFQAYRSVMRYLINHESTHIAACGKAAGEYLFGQKMFQKRGILIRNGMEIDRFKFRLESRNKIRNQWGLKDKFVIGHVGRFAKEKNHKFLIDTFQEILKIKSESKLLLIGDGSLKDKIKQYCQQLGIEQQVIFTGEVTNIEEFLSAMDVFAFPSFYEGFPVSVIEAQTSGLICFLSETITKEVQISPNITFLRLEDGTKKWAEAILKTKFNPREQAHQFIESAGFSICTQVKILEKIYAEG